jgi:predicted naringenin-chalcone synthase
MVSPSMVRTHGIKDLFSRLIARTITHLLHMKVYQLLSPKANGCRGIQLGHYFPKGRLVNLYVYSTHLVTYYIIPGQNYEKFFKVANFARII